MGKGNTKNDNNNKEKNNKNNKEKKKSFMQEFREFAVQGNVIDMAIGVIIGGAFGKIITSLVNDILMPVLSLIIGIVNFENLKFVKEFKGINGEIQTLSIPYGNFIQTVVNFLIIAFCIFLMVKGITKVKDKFEKEEAKDENEPEEKKEVTNEEKLLKEIRDDLNKIVNNNNNNKK